MLNSPSIVPLLVLAIVVDIFFVVALVLSHTKIERLEAELKKDIVTIQRNTKGRGWNVKRATDEEYLLSSIAPLYFTPHADESVVFSDVTSAAKTARQMGLRVIGVE